MTTWFDGHDRTPEGARDERMGELLREIVGDPAAAVDWDRLAGRIAAALPLSRAAPWWSYAERWQRHAVPLALAAGLAGLLAIWQGSSSAARSEPGASEMLSAVMAGTPTADVARSYARSVTSAIDPSNGVIE